MTFHKKYPIVQKMFLFQGSFDFLHWQVTDHFILSEHKSQPTNNWNRKTLCSELPSNVKRWKNLLGKGTVLTHWRKLESEVSRLLDRLENLKVCMCICDLSDFLENNYFTDCVLSASFIISGLRRDYIMLKKRQLQLS